MRQRIFDLTHSLGRITNREGRLNGFWGLNLRSFGVVILALGLTATASLRTVGTVGTFRLAAIVAVLAMSAGLSRCVWHLVTTQRRIVRWVVTVGIVVVTMVACFYAVPRIDRWRALSALDRRRAYIDYETQLKAPRWIMTLVGEDVWLKLTGKAHTIVLAGPRDQLADHEFEQLAKISEVEVLHFEATNLKDSDLAYLRSLANLKRLFIGGSSEGQVITDKGVAHLKQLTLLTHLSLTNARVTNDGLKELSGLTRLQFLGLDGTDVSDEGLIHLQRMVGLRQIGLANTSVTDGVIGELQRVLPGSWTSSPGGFVR